MKPFRETDEVAAAGCRMIRSVGRRAAEEDPGTLRHLRALDVELAAAWENAIQGLRRAGFTDTEIGRVLGTTKQAVHQRWPRKPGREAAA